MNIEWVYIVDIIVTIPFYWGIPDIKVFPRGEWNMEGVETNLLISRLLSINSDIFGGRWRGID
jgi:hypothetical protein